MTGIGDSPHARAQKICEYLFMSNATIVKPIEISRPLPPAPASPHYDPFKTDAERARRKAIFDAEVFHTRIIRERLATRKIQDMYRPVAVAAINWLLAQDLDFWRRYQASSPRELFTHVYNQDLAIHDAMDAVNCEVKEVARG